MSEDSSSMESPRRWINPYKQFHGSMIPNWLLKRTELSPGAKLCYARLAQFSGKDGECFPKQVTLAEELGVTRSMVIRYLKELRVMALIERKRRGLTKSNRYFFLHHPWMEFAKKADLASSSSTNTQEVPHVGSLVGAEDEQPDVADLQLPPISRRESNLKEPEKRNVSHVASIVPSDAETDDFLRVWSKEYEESMGVIYGAISEKDRQAAINLLSYYSVEEIMDVAVVAWGQRDEEFFCKHSVSIGSFWGSFNNIRHETGHLHYYIPDEIKN